MKKLVCVLLTVILVEISFSQEKFSFVDDDMQWSYMTAENSEMWEYKVPTIVTTTYKYNGDTIINTVSYKKMYRTTNKGKKWDEFGYFRQKDAKVYYIAKNETDEKLAYDFSTNMECRIKSNHDDISLASDSTIINNVKKARWGFYHIMHCENVEYGEPCEPLDNKYYYIDIILEDVGSIFSPTFDTLFFCSGTYAGCQFITSLLCVQKGNDVIWHNPNYEDCYYERTAINNTANQQIQISPNPVKDKLTLTLSQAENEIKIFDLQGKLLLQQNVGFSAEINVSMLQTGTYVLVVNGESYKFVKE